MIIYTENRLMVHFQLIENELYKLDFEDADPIQVEKEINDSKLKDHISWYKGNKIGSLKITNYIGNIYFFGKTYNVKSNKFLNELDGETQFRTILDEIISLSKNLIFSYNSPSFAVREKDYENSNPSNLLIYNYFKNIITNKTLREKLEIDIARVIKNPTFNYSHLYRKENIEKCINIDSKSLNLITYKVNDFILLGEQNKHLKNLSLTNLFSKDHTLKYFPKKGLNKSYELNYDTSENRFIKYFIEFIYSSVYYLSRDNNGSRVDTADIDEMLHFCRKILNMHFFKKIGRLKIIPMNSPALLNRAGYKEIFAHYRNCRLGIKYIIQDFEINLMSIDLKKISDLYEYWVFINICKAFLDNEIFLEQKRLLNFDDNISYRTCMKNSVISIYYNLTESHAKGTSYSVTFRPDITIIYHKNGKKFKFIFDAKYKINNINKQTKKAKNEDLYKMHAYLDAINSVEFAFVVYPGTEFYFYEKGEIPVKRNCIENIEKFKGIGAIPLTPGNKLQFEQLVDLAHKLREHMIDVSPNFDIQR